MKFLFYISMSVFISVCFISCKNSHTYDKQVRELDSLKIVVQQSLDNFKAIDSASCMLAYSKLYTYSNFISYRLKDTVTKSVAENLQSFYFIKEGLNNFLALRFEWISKANQSIKQLQTLSSDLKAGSVEEEEAIEFINKEKKQAEQIIEELKVNSQEIRKHLDIFNQSLPVCEELVRQLNAGVLPVLLTPKIKRLKQS